MVIVCSSLYTAGSASEVFFSLLIILETAHGSVVIMHLVLMLLLLFQLQTILRPENANVLSALAHTVEGNHAKLEALQTISWLVYHRKLILCAEVIREASANSLAYKIVSLLQDYWS